MRFYTPYKGTEKMGLLATCLPIRRLLVGKMRKKDGTGSYAATGGLNKASQEIVYI